ncbi:MAG: hypothetical protein AB1428_12965 [Bacteroidota bacterium]
MSTVIDAYLVLLGFVAGFALIGWATFGRMRRRLDRDVPRPPKIDRNVRPLTEEEHRGLVGEILPGDMLDHLRRGPDCGAQSTSEGSPADSITHRIVSLN